MRKNPSAAELLEHEAETEAHNLVLEWRDWLRLEGGEAPRDLRGVQAFAEWILAKRPPPGDVLRDLAARLTPNPAMTAEGTLAVLLDGIDRIENEWLARALAHINARQQGMDAAPLTDEQWREGDIHAKLRLLNAAQSLKDALREASKPANVLARPN